MNVYSEAMSDTSPKNEFSLAGKLLLAMPGLADPRFHRAVIFMCAHDDNGAMGLIVNHHLPNLDFSQLLQKMHMDDEVFEDLQGLDMKILSGGPVENGRGFLLHDSDFSDKDTIRITDDFSVTGTLDALQKIAKGQGPEQSLFILGHAGWGKDQLEREIGEGSWLVSEPKASIIFHEQRDEIWTLAVRDMGVDPAALSHTSGHA